jgi:hypothetical protein
MPLRLLEDPLTADWRCTITYSDYNKMLKGWMGESMDDKWMVFTDTPDNEGNTVVHVCRSWTGIENFSLKIVAGNPNETEAKEWGTTVQISWLEYTRSIPETKVTEEDVKKRARGLCRRLLGCETGHWSI